MPEFSVTPDAAQRFVAAAVSPRLAYRDGERTDTQEVDRATSLPLWRVTVFVMDADSSRTPAQLSVTVPAATAPAVAALQPVQFTGLRVRTWSGGASFRADSVEAVADSTQPDGSASSSFLSDINGVEDGE